MRVKIKATDMVDIDIESSPAEMMEILKLKGEAAAFAREVLKDVDLATIIKEAWVMLKDFLEFAEEDFKEGRPASAAKRWWNKNDEPTRPSSDQN